MTTATDTTPLTNLWRLRMANRQVLLLAKLRAILVRTFRPDDVDASMALLAPAVASWVSAAQAASVSDTQLYLTHLAESAELVHSDPAGLVGVDMEGRPLTELIGMGGSMYRDRANNGLATAINVVMLMSFLNRVGGSEPYRAANGTVLSAAGSNPRIFTGRVYRITRPGACKFCADIAQQGYTGAHAGFQAHAHCHCTAQPERT